MIEAGKEGRGSKVLEAGRVLGGSGLCGAPAFEEPRSACVVGEWVEDSCEFCYLSWGADCGLYE